MARAQNTMRQNAVDWNAATQRSLIIVIPVYNEGGNFPRLWGNLCSTIRSAFTLLVVYDFHEDDTIPAVEAIINKGENRIRLVRNNIRKGVVGAIVTGFNQIEHGPVLCRDGRSFR